jgi:nucleotide-binding universal stress UspA family protein
MKVLLAVDGSEHSMQTLNMVRSTAWPPGTTVRVVSAVTYSPPPSAAPTWSGVSIGVEEYEASLRSSAERVAARAAEMLDHEGLTVETVVRNGDLRRVILDEAKQWSADLIVLGSPGVSGLRRWLHASVEQYVVARAPCSVEVVRTKAAA